MATLLCSLLLGSNFNAFVVSGYAVREVTQNNQTRVVCPAIPTVQECVEVREPTPEVSSDEDEDADEQPAEGTTKYQLKAPIDLTSQFLAKLDAEAERKRQEQLAEKKAEERRRLEELERLPPDELQSQRVHAWVLVMVRPDDIFFIEPATGFRAEISDSAFVAIESIWNHENYFVNKQTEIRGAIGDLCWTLHDRSHWERLLDVESDFPASSIISKYLDMPLSWVQRLSVSRSEYERLFPAAEKTIHYKRTIQERYGRYEQVDGLVERITRFEALDYTGPLEMWERYENRRDLLSEKHTLFRAENLVYQHFGKGRPDALKMVLGTREREADGIKKFVFFSKSRLDGLRALELVDQTGIREFYDKGM